MAKKILVVDDDKLIRESLAAMLRNQGHVVVEAADGQEGIKVAEKERPDLVITDIRMPVLDGSEMIKQLRSQDYGSHLPIIVLSNDETTNTINVTLAAGVTTYLSKSTLQPETLAEQVTDALREL